MISFKLPARKDYPKKIYVKSVYYKVQFKKDLKCYGITDSGKRTITLKTSLPPRAMLTTFIHEVLHAIEFESPKTKLKHKQVYALEEAIMEILLDNFL